MSALFYRRRFSLVFIIISILRLFAEITSLDTDKRSPEVCHSKECIAMSENILRKMDFTVDPCQDFYSYSCGKYTEINAKTEIEKPALLVTKRLIEIVKKPPSKDDHTILKMTKQMFKFCLQHNSNIEALKNMITQLGGWSLLDPNWRVKDFSLVKFFSESMKIGYFPKSLFGIDVKSNPYTKQKINIIAITPREESSTGLVKRIFRPKWSLDSAANGRSIDEYYQKQFIPMLAEKMKINKNKLENELIEMDNVGDIIDAIYETPEDPQILKLSEVKALCDGIPWIELFDVVFKPFKIKITYNDTIRVVCPKCLLSLNNLIQNTSTKSLVTYLMGSFIIDTVLDADDEMLTQWLQVDNNSKEDYCTDKIFNPFRRVLDYEYYKQYHDSSLTSMVRDFIQKLKVTMVAVITSSDLVDDEKIRTQTIDKVNKMVFKISFDDETIQGKQILLKYFDKLNVNPSQTSYLPSFFKLMKFTTEKLLENLGKPGKIPYLTATARNTNAEYYTYYNIVFISANLLTGILYAKGNRPQYLNFGGLGTLVAHEMNHAFDPSGHQFDNHGVQRRFWNPTTIQRYFQKIECIANQYSNFINVATGNKVNGHLTLAENFCDIGGMEIAYKAYRDFPKRGESLLPNFPNTTLQRMFWISYATTWCANPSKENILKHEKTDVHAIERIRVNGVAMNSKEFASDWNCAKNTPMNPVKKCKVWKSSVYFI